MECDTEVVIVGDVDVAVVVDDETIDEKEEVEDEDEEEENDVGPWPTLKLVLMPLLPVCSHPQLLLEFEFGGGSCVAGSTVATATRVGDC